MVPGPARLADGRLPMRSLRPASAAAAPLAMSGPDGELPHARRIARIDVSARARLGQMAEAPLSPSCPLGAQRRRGYQGVCIRHIMLQMQGCFSDGARAKASLSITSSRRRSRCTLFPDRHVLRPALHAASLEALCLCRPAAALGRQAVAARESTNLGHAPGAHHMCKTEHALGSHNRGTRSGHALRACTPPASLWPALEVHTRGTLGARTQQTHTHTQVVDVG